MSKNIKLILVAMFFIATWTSASAQRIAVTSNLVEDVVLTPNVGVDIVLADRQSLAFDVSYSPYQVAESFHNMRMTFRAGYKFRFNQAMYAHYIGVDAVLSSSDVGLAKFKSKDEYVGVGVGYGYSFILGKRLNLVPNIGIGIAYGNNYEGYDHMLAPGKGVEASVTAGFKPIITRLGVTIQYVLK